MRFDLQFLRFTDRRFPIVAIFNNVPIPLKFGHSLVKRSKDRVNRFFR